MRLFQIFKIALDNIEHAKTSITDFNYRKVPIKRPWALAAQAQKKKSGLCPYTENLLECLNELLASTHPRLPNLLRQSRDLLLYKTRNGAYTSHHHFTTFENCQSSSSTAPFKDFMSTSLCGRQKSAKSSPQFGRHQTRMTALQSPYGRVH